MIKKIKDFTVKKVEEALQYLASKINENIEQINKNEEAIQELSDWINKDRETRKKVQKGLYDMKKVNVYSVKKTNEELKSEEAKKIVRQKYCPTCGSQRCTAEDDWIESCDHYKDVLSDLKKEYTSKQERVKPWPDPPVNKDEDSTEDERTFETQYLKTIKKKHGYENIIGLKGHPDTNNQNKFYNVETGDEIDMKDIKNGCYATIKFKNKAQRAFDEGIALERKRIIGDINDLIMTFDEYVEDENHIIEILKELKKDIKSKTIKEITGADYVKDIDIKDYYSPDKSKKLKDIIEDERAYIYESSPALTEFAKGALKELERLEKRIQE